MDVSIIIVNYNTIELTKNCIKSVREKTSGLDYEIILVDNASSDGSQECFQEDKDLIFIQSNENIGFGRANNLGFIRASGKYVFLLNSDTVLNNNAVKIFFDFMENSSDSISCCGSILKDGEGNVIHSFGDFHTLKNCLDEWIFADIKSKMGFGRNLLKYDNPRKVMPKAFCVDFVTGADLFLKKYVADKYGLFDPDFFMYSEDMELQRRYAKHGMKSCIVDGPEITHLVGKSFKKKKLNRKEMVLKSLFLYKKKELNCVGYLFFVGVFKMAYAISFVLRNNLTIKEKISHITNVLKIRP